MYKGVERGREREGGRGDSSYAGDGEQTEGRETQVKPSSVWHAALQPSPSTPLASSHVSPLPSTPSPQTAGRTSAVQGERERTMRRMRRRKGGKC